MRTLYIFLLLVTLSFPFFSVTAETALHEDLQETVPATVLQILNTTTRELDGLNTTITIQSIEILIEDGERKGQTAIFDNEIGTVYPGDRIFVNRLVTIQGYEYYILKDVDRRTELIVLGVLLIGMIVWFAGIQGIRAIASLIASIGAIVFILIPTLLSGYDPVLASLAISAIILATVLFGTHGFNPVSSIAFFGTLSAVALSGVLAYLFVNAMRFNGFSSDASVFLNFSTGGTLDFSGLLLGSIIIGMLGVLDDVSITQASVVRELKSANPTLSIRELYVRALRVGKDHVGSLVNTLALAYVGVSLPLILLFARADTSLTLTLNQELFAAEFTRIIIGSIGIIMAVPFTTILGAWYYGTHQVEASGHSHHHHHHH
jgi:uncharacterized membrane protein